MLDKQEKSQARQTFEVNGRKMFLSNETISWFLGRATPGQLQAVCELLEYEQRLRDANKRVRLLRRARFPVVKSLSDFDNADLLFPGDYCWDDLTSLLWLDEKQDFVFHGPTGRGNYEKKMIMLRNGLSSLQAALRQPCSFA